MSTADVLSELQSRIAAGYSVLFLNSLEELRWEQAIADLAEELEYGMVLWSATKGAEPAVRESEAETSRDPAHFLKQVGAYPSEHIFLVRDFGPYLEDPVVLRGLRDLSEELPAQHKVLLLLGATPEIPESLSKDVTQLDLPLPGVAELRGVLEDVRRENAAAGGPEIDISPTEADQLVTTVLGMTAQEAGQALKLVTQGRERLDEAAFVELVAEKQRRISGSELLEFIDLDDSIANIGGLEGLKDWLSARGQAFSPQAREQGVPMPKGVLLFGVQGCGKSLTARATAHLLRFPLIRLDLANLLSSDRGASERNMRDVLKLLETLAPAVLWLDELDKGFAGLENGGDDAAVTRLFGRFLVWMEEKKAPIFVTATANSVQNLPPELLRRGRFDEMFFIDLPNFYERTQIFKVHLHRRGWKPSKFDVDALVNMTEGYSGAEIQQIVSTATLESYSSGGLLTQEALAQACEQIVPLSVTMEDKIFALREWARERCRPATADSRVMRMLEDEDRAIAAEVVEEAEERWSELADMGQTSAAICEFVRARDEVTFRDIQETFAQFIDTEGNQGLALRTDPNIVLWVGISAELATMLGKLIRDRQLFLRPVKPAKYGSQGLELPTLEKFSAERLPSPHWLVGTLMTTQPDNWNTRLERVTRMQFLR